MIEEILKLIITELGPTGILVCGLYAILKKAITSGNDSLDKINCALSKIEKNLHACTHMLAKKYNGKDRRYTGYSE